ncbi:MAG: efflux RND transporter periplasmic adaptor subunit [Nitrosomonas sp.]|uniref:efflux RND transporter periplasmic adaptor subunit n=1 Tax=Nitrosomonas sp. TaxID=42353 RepID=UPI00273329AD|nr:efflux RND transporter periplasmic adaptor subunit [Nitrosomonas sp.]MDP3663017.1 efflux RND transporter periplasmic adaptor subunit [Nitrosomonas sp.]MDZ4106994.1 efflux RND transporter periplasmic adaptor subunit [Nitrosomonas sp.]
MMYAKASATLFLNVIFLLTCTGAFAETSCRLDTKQGIGALGRIEPRSRVIKVSHNAGPEGARVEQLFFQEADSVQAGEKLAVLSDHVKRKAEVQAAGTRIKVLEAQRAVEQVALTFNKKEHLRHQSLDPGAVSISLVDEKRLAYEQSLADLKRLSAEITRAQAEQKIAEAELDNTLITAPITGTVVKIFARQGERIGDNGLLQIADLSQLDVVAEVYESELPQVKIGQTGCITATGFKRSYRAMVRELGFLVRKNDLNDTDPLADRDNRIIEVRLTLEPEAVADLQHQIFRQVKVRIVP